MASLRPRDQGRQGQACSRRLHDALPGWSPALPNTAGFPHPGLGPSRKTGARTTGRKQPCDLLSPDALTLPVLGSNRWQEASTGQVPHTPPGERGPGPPPTIQASEERRDGQGRRGHPARTPQQPLRHMPATQVAVRWTPNRKRRPHVYCPNLCRRHSPTELSFPGRLGPSPGLS